MPGEENDRPPASHAEVLENTNSNAQRVRDIVKHLVCSQHLFSYLSDDPELNPLALNPNPITGSPHVSASHTKHEECEKKGTDEEETKLNVLIQGRNKYELF